MQLKFPENRPIQFLATQSAVHFTPVIKSVGKVLNWHSFEAFLFYKGHNFLVVDMPISTQRRLVVTSGPGGNEEADRHHISPSWTPLVAPLSIVVEVVYCSSGSGTTTSSNTATTTTSFAAEPHLSPPIPL